MINPLYGQTVIAVLGGLGLYLLKQAAEAALELRDNVRDLMTNHLPHIYHELQDIRAELSRVPKPMVVEDVAKPIPVVIVGEKQT